MGTRAAGRAYLLPGREPLCVEKYFGRVFGMGKVRLYAGDGETSNIRGNSNCSV